MKRCIEQCLVLSEHSINSAIVVHYNKAPGAGKDFENPVFNSDNVYFMNEAVDSHG